MAELRSTTAIGGNIVWHGGNLRFDPQGETVLYNGHKVFTEHDTPLPSELGNGGTTSAYTKTESNATFAPIHAAGYVRKDGDTMTGKLTTSGNDIEIQGSSPRLTLVDGAKKWFVVNDGGNWSVREDTTSTQRLILSSDDFNISVDAVKLQGKAAFRAFDSWLRINDDAGFTDGIYFGSSMVRTDGTLQVGSSTTSGLYATSSTFKYQNNRVFHDAYHPNADKWTTARTLTLSGDVSGSVSWDGSTNVTLTVAVANDSHTHDGRYYTETESDSRYVNVAGDTMTGDLKVAKSNGSLEVNSTANTNAELRLTEDSGNHGVILRYEGDENDWQLIRRNSNVDNVVMSGTRESNNVYMNGGIYANANQRVFADNYHPNADKWTNARTLTLSGDASGSIVWDGSTNVTLTVAVANDSHTHDGRYYTETESDSRFAPISGGVYVTKSGDTMTGDLTLGANDLIFDTDAFITRDVNPGTSLVPGSNNGLNIHGPGNGHVNVVLYANDGNDAFNVLSSTGTTTSGHVINKRSFWVSGTSGNTYAAGNLYANNSSRVFADNYHPNADKWTTARTLTTTLTGDVSGTASMSVDGSGNKTVSITTTVANDSHLHTRLDPLNANWNTQTDEFRTGSASNVAGAPTDEFINWIQWGHNGGSKFRHTLYSATGAIDQLRYAYRNNTSTTAADHAEQRIFMDNYHPNADKWTTARTITLSGDASGSVSIDGSANKTLTVTVADDSHRHDKFETTLSSRTTSNADTVGDNSGFLVRYLTAGATGAPEGQDHAIQTNSYSSSWQTQQASDWRTNAWYVRGQDNGTWSSWERLFADNYHPNADKWTTARTLTTTLTGDVTGSASMSVDGSGNKTVSITTTVANDSHTHDGRYYTESESNAKYAQLAGATFTGLINANAGIALDDNDYIYFGTGNDVEFFCNGSHMYTDLNDGIGNWYIRDASTTRFTFDDAGHFTATGNVTAYSDIRLKSNIERIENPLEKVLQLNGYVYDKKRSLHEDETSRETGVIAQEVEAVLPEAVRVDENDEDGIKSVAYGNLSGLLIESIKELNEKVETLQSEVHELKKPWWKKILGL
ncbi:long tail fiber protein distal subunit [Vibrio phage K567]